MRVSELRGLTCQDAQLGSGAHIRCQGKGRYLDVSVIPMSHM
jgi:hypothetical protein